MFIDFNKFLAEGSSGHDLLLLSSRGPCSHNFVISHLLINAARSVKKIRLICFGESRQFYSLVCQRAGVSLQSLEDSGKLRTFCGVTVWKKEIASGGTPTIPTEVKELVGGDDELTIVDDVLPLLDIAKSDAVVKFVHRLKSSTSAAMLAVGIRAEDREAERTMKLLRAMSSLWVDVYPLSTGYSKELHGVVEMWAFKPHSEGTLQRKMHYRVTERGAKLLLIGSHTAVT